MIANVLCGTFIYRVSVCKHQIFFFFIASIPRNSRLRYVIWFAFKNKVKWEYGINKVAYHIWNLDRRQYKFVWPTMSKYFSFIYSTMNRQILLCKEINWKCFPIILNSAVFVGLLDESAWVQIWNKGIYGKNISFDDYLLSEQTNFTGNWNCS